jgi:hypothetical protein
MLSIWLTIRRQNDRLAGPIVPALLRMIRFSKDHAPVERLSRNHLKRLRFKVPP